MSLQFHFECESLVSEFIVSISVKVANNRALNCYARFGDVLNIFSQAQHYLGNI